MECCFFYSRCDRIRTCDLCVPNAALYQAEPRIDIPINKHDIKSCLFIVPHLYFIVYRIFYFYMIFLAISNAANRYILLHYASNNLILPLCIRMITHWHINPVVLLHHALSVTEGLESDLAMITSHSTAANTTKSHLRGR